VVVSDVGERPHRVAIEVEPHPLVLDFRDRRRGDGETPAAERRRNGEWSGVPSRTWQDVSARMQRSPA
jgi:hypothetical protein